MVEKHSQRQKPPRNSRQVLNRINYVYDPKKGNVEVPDEAVTGMDHFSVYLDPRGQEVKREDYEKGQLRRVTISRYDSTGRLEHQEVYSASRQFFRKRRLDGTLEEFADDDTFIRRLRED